MTNDLLTQLDERLHDSGIDWLDLLPDLPAEARDFLGRLCLLNGVPLNHLLPDERYLPKRMVTKEGYGSIEQGSIRFFRLDTEWIECLVGGALSVGEEESQELILRKALAGNYIAEVVYKDAVAQFDRQKLGALMPDEYDQQLQERLVRKAITLKNGQPAPTEGQSNWRYSGFFLRSSILTMWKGVEVKPLGKSSKTEILAGSKPLKPLQVLCFERIAPDILFFLCEDIITSIEITQPYETMHYGFKENAEGKLKFGDKDRLVIYRDEEKDDGVIDIAALCADDNNSSSSLAKQLLSDTLPIKINIDVSWSSQNI